MENLQYESCVSQKIIKLCILQPFHLKTFAIFNKLNLLDVFIFKKPFPWVEKWAHGKEVIGPIGPINPPASPC
jgi:hypothetical protein